MFKIVLTYHYFSDRPCDEGYVKCADGLQCIAQWDMCDGVAYCNDGSDEDPGVCKGNVPNRKSTINQINQFFLVCLMVFKTTFNNISAI